MNYLSICSVMLNEEDYVEDFVNFHKFLGVEHFYIFDKSNDGLDKVLGKRDYVTLIKAPKDMLHAVAWQQGAQLTKTKSEWVAFIDCDEFLVPHTTLDLKELMSKYEAYSSLQPNWCLYGSSGHIEKPKENQLLAFTKRARKDHPINAHTQSIIKPKHVVNRATDDPHHFPLLPGKVSVNENNVLIPNSPFSSPPSQNKIQINHYYTRSKEEVKIKLTRRRCDVKDLAYHENLFEETNVYANEEEDLCAANIYKKMMGI
ncbi:MAG: glycosyltransferase family 2 protein [Chitinophagales bacterium]|nr:glycosyltransferase family 2 protein [Chitinophagales bacterium]